MSGASAELPLSTEPFSSAPAAPVVVAILPTFIPSLEAFFAATFVQPDAPIVESPETGGLTDDDFLDLWKSVTDPGYHLPILEKTDGGGDEVKAALAIHKMVSQKIDASTQSLYILAWSGQTADPSHLANVATGHLQISRLSTDSFPAWLPVILQPDQFMAEHVGIDWSDEGPIEVLTGRRYFFTQLSSLGPGQLGPLLYPARAEKPGSSYNVPGPGTIVRVSQAGSGLTNTGATTSAPSAAANWLVLAPAPDLLSEPQVGQYVRLTAPPALAGQVRRLVSYVPPVDETTGGTGVLDTLGVFAVGSVVGNFAIGEQVTQASSGAQGILVSKTASHFAIETFVGVFTSTAIVGSASAATATITSTVRASALPAAVGTVAWVVLDWELDVGLSVTNPASFTGGRLPILEELGSERNIFHASDEPEEVYRRRVASAADVVSPNALLRTVNRILAGYSGQGCLREVGSTKLPGVFFDVPPDGNPVHAFAYDMDPVVRPGDLWKVAFDLTEMRAFFLMGLPALGIAALNAAVYSALFRAKAGGVGFDLYEETGGCV